MKNSDIGTEFDKKNVTSPGISWGASFVFAASALCLGLIAPSPSLASGEASSAKVGSSAAIDIPGFEENLRRLLGEKPEIIIEALRNFEMKESAARAEARAAALADKSDKFMATDSGIVLGNPDGSIVIAEFTDPNCPYCRKMEPVKKDLIAANPDLKIVMRPFPVLGPASELAARIMIAVKDTPGAVGLKDALYNSPSRLDENTVWLIAGSKGYDVEKLREIAESDEVRSILEGNLSLGRAAGIQGTPGYIIQGKYPVEGAAPAEEFQALIDRARQKN